MDGELAQNSNNRLSAADDRSYLIRGGRRLRGTIAVRGAKNAISKQLVASLLTTEPCVFRNVPRIAEIDAILAMLTEVGTEYAWLDRNSLRIQTPEIRSTQVGQQYSGFNRIPILMLSPLLQRAGAASVPTVGGCPIGPRPVDFHIQALQQMGAEIDLTAAGFSATSTASGRTRLQGASVHLPYPSVGATENTLFAAVLAQGTTVIENAAVEPEVVDTILFLQKMGAQVLVDADRRIIVEGVDRLQGAEHTTITDRIEVASFAAAAVATDGRVTIRNACQAHMPSFLNMLRKAGGGFRVDEEGITFFRDAKTLSAVHLETGVHPGFMTDWQQPFAVLLTQAQGTSVIHETVYENRFGYTDALNRMGANIELSDECLGRRRCRFRNQGHAHSCRITGPSPLHGCPIRIPDLRAGFAYVMAALVARGQSQLTGLQYLERGYEDVPTKLRSINADIEVRESDVRYRRAG